MKIMDEKGRLFGKVSIIDAVVVVFVIMLCIVCTYKYINRNKDNNSQKDTEKLVVTFLAEEVPEYVPQTLKEGKNVKESQWRTNLGTLTSYKVAPSISYATTFQGDYIKTTKEGYNSVEAVIDSVGYFDETGVRIEGQLFLVGKYMTIEIGEGAYWGRISSIKPIGG